MPESTEQARREAAARLGDIVRQAGITAALLRSSGLLAAADQVEATLVALGSAQSSVRAVLRERDQGAP